MAVNKQTPQCRENGAIIGSEKNVNVIQLTMRKNPITTLSSCFRRTSLEDVITVTEKFTAPQSSKRKMVPDAAGSEVHESERNS